MQRRYASASHDRVVQCKTWGQSSRLEIQYPLQESECSQKLRYNRKIATYSLRYEISLSEVLFPGDVVDGHG